MQKPLNGCSVLDLTQNVAGPFCTQILADLGADVVKIESVDAGDSTRQWGPPFWGPESTMFLAFNRNKRSISLNLRQKEAQQIIERLLDRSHVFVHSIRPSSAERLGLDAATLRQRYPKLLVCEISAYGKTGPLAETPGYDPILQGFCGLMSVTGHEGSPPVRIGTSIVDMGTGLWAALGIVAALLQRAKGSSVGSVSTSLFESGLAWLPYQALGYMATGQIPRRWGSELPMLAPYGAYATSDEAIMIAAGNDAIWRRLCKVVDPTGGLLKEERFSSNPRRVAHRNELREVLERLLVAANAATWIDRLSREGVPVGAINDVATVLSHPQTEATGMLSHLAHPEIPDLPLVGIPLEFDAHRPPVDIPPPSLGQHTDTLLRELGFSEEQLESLSARGAIRRYQPSDEHKKGGPSAFDR